MIYENMEEDEYVETSDVEELADAYTSRHLDEVDLTVENPLKAARARTPQRSPKIYRTPRKRRKLSHVAEDTGDFVPSSQASIPQADTFSSQSISSETNPNLNGSDKRNVDTNVVLDSPGVMMEVDKEPGSQSPTGAQEVSQAGLPIDEGAVMEHVKAWASWTTPRKATGSQKVLQSAQKHSQRTAAPIDYEGDLLNRFEQSLSPQAFSGRPTSSPAAAEKSQVQDSEREESEDELAVIPPKSTSSIPTSQSGSKSSGKIETSFTRADTLSNTPNSSPLSSVGSPRPLAGNNHSPVAEDRITASTRTSTTEIGSVEGEAFTRYPLRRRQPNQLRPYLYDEYQYKNVLKHNPAAIINGLRLQKRRTDRQEDRYEEDDDDYVQEESQQQAGTRVDETQEERAHSPARPLPAYIKPLSESSDDNSDDLAQEARRIMKDKRRREKEIKEKEQEERRQKEEKRRRERERSRREKEATRAPRRFPVFNASSHPERHDSDITDDQDASPARRTRHSRTPSVPRSSLSPPARQSISDEVTNELGVLRDYFMDDISASVEEDVPHVTEPEPLPFNAEEPPEVIEPENRASPALGKRRENSDSGPNDSDGAEPPDLGKRYRELFKLYPPGMARRLLAEKKQHPSRPLISDDSEGDEPLLPGQSRIRRTANPKDVRTIRGDSESDENEVGRRFPSLQYMYNGDIRDFLDHETPSDPTSSVRQDSEPRDLRPPRPASHPQVMRQPAAPTPEIIEISDGESTSSSEEEQVDEEDIQILLRDDDAGTIYDEDTRGGPVKEESMIDWMLSRTRIVGPTISRPKIGKRKKRRSRTTGQPRNGNSSSTQNKYKLDVTTRDARKFGNERQTLLSFEKHTTTSKNLKNDRPKAGMATEPIEVEVQEPGRDQRKSWKDRRKERRERHKLQGVYSMANPLASGITSGRSRKPMKITIDLDDDDFYQSFVPRSEPTGTALTKGKKAGSPPLRVGNNTGQHLEAPDQSHHRRRLTKRPGDLVGNCTVDMGIEALSPGVSFGSTSFIREGHLHALVDTLTSDHAPRPNPTYLCGISLSPTLEMNVFLQNLDKTFEGLLGLISDIPSEGYEENIKNWDSLSRSACQHITWLYARDNVDERSRLSIHVKNKVLAIISDLKSMDVPSHPLNIALLSLCWFCLETSIRAGYQLFDESSGPLELNPAHASVKLLLHYLMEYGVRKPYKTMRKSQDLDETKMPSYVAQVWVCLLHLLPACDTRRAASSNSYLDNPLWVELLAYYQSLPSANFLETSERIWKTVFTLMTLSQFSVLGIAGSNFRLPSSWSLVAYAIKQAHLAQGSSNLQHLGPNTLEKRDNYINVVISRCYRLLDYWKWKMDQSFVALNQLVDIFRARNFVNLHREEAEYPDFMLNGDWDALSQLRSETDSGFASILKLFMRAVDSGCLTKPEIKKMIALIIPVSRFRTQEEKIPGVDDLSPICNRFAALALAIAIEPGYATRTVNQVHSSIDFPASDSTTQVLTIRGIKLLATLMIQKDVPLQEVAKWLASIICSVASEFKSLRSSTVAEQRERGNKFRNCSLLILSLYATGRAVIETFASRRRCPEPAFLFAFRPFLEHSKAIEEATHNLSEMRRFIESYLDLRANFLPLREPTLPTPQIDDSESQEYASFDFGIDLNDPTTLAQLDGQENGFTSLEQGEFPDKIIFPFFWAACRKVQRFCVAAAEPVVDSDALRTLDSWAHCFTGCLYILIQHNTVHSGWSFGLNEVEPFWRKTRISWLNVRVRVAVYTETIRHDPGFYGLRTRELLELFFESLTTHSLTAEPKYWLYIVASEVNNPLFKDLAEPLAAFNAEVSPQMTHIQELRMTLVKGLFRNVEAGLEELSDTIPRNSASIDFCLKFFSMIRSNSQEFSSRSELSTSYSAWYKEIYALLANYPRLKSHQRLKTILDLLS